MSGDKNLCRGRFVALRSDGRTPDLDRLNSNGPALQRRLARDGLLPHQLSMRRREGGAVLKELSIASAGRSTVARCGYRAGFPDARPGGLMEQLSANPDKVDCCS